MESVEFRDSSWVESILSHTDLTDLFNSSILQFFNSNWSLRSKLKQKLKTKNSKTPVGAISLSDFAALQVLQPLWTSSQFFSTWTTAPAFVRLYHRQEKPRKQFTAYGLLVLVTLFFSAKRGVLLLGCLSLQGGFRFVWQRRQVHLDSMTHELKTNGRKTINNREGF